MPDSTVCIEHGIGNLHKYLQNKTPEEKARWAREWGDTNEATKIMSKRV